ncbi:MAG: putative Ig domain-containing protein, partial [Actinobacteria bacterium]|nr:putative Ig domain-containing protein [Actinomycetota bacterium]
GSDAQSLSVSLINVNEAPTISSGTPANTVEDGASYSFVPTASDVDAGTVLTYSINVALPSWASFNTTTGELSANPVPADVGDSITGIVIGVSDGSLSASLAAFDLTVILSNQAPTISGAPDTGVGDDVPYSFVPTASDADAGDTLTFSIINKPSWAAFDSASGALTGTPASSNIGTTSGIVISVSDGSLRTDLAAFDLKVFADNDNDNISDLLDPDDDNDGMTDVWELANGLDPLDPNDASTDSDGDGVSNLDEYTANSDPQTDDYTPVVTAPADVNIDATGLYTAVDVGTGSANDGLDGAVTATSNASSHFAPGVHMVTWSAADAAGNTGTATQLINVVPLVNLSIDQTAREGDSITIKAILNGDAVAYPVDVPYTVSGSADASDHNLVGGTITINSPELEAIVSIDLVDDGAGEGDETLIVTMGIPTNAVQGSSTVHTATITEINVDPEVVLSADQGSGTTTLVAQADGSVIVTAIVTDSTGDTHSYDWTATDNAMSDTDGAADTFSFDPALLLPGVYTLRVAVTDNNSGSSEADLTLKVVASAPLLTATDTDGDGTNDDVEGYGDEDNDGIINYLDHG